VLAALYELMRGFQAANDVRKGELLRDVLADDPNHVYAGLLRVLMRLVFVMYAEDRDLLSSDPIYSNHYSVTGLFNRLREDAGRFPDTMNQRFGAWSQLITLFRLIYEGGQHNDFKLPPRKGYLFDPDRYPFLEGRTKYKPEAQASESAEPSEAQASESESSGNTDTHSLARRACMDIPRISDGIVFNVLQNLLILDGERLSYRTLDVEQIGSVYETVMGFNLEVAAGKSIAIKPAKSHGAPATINLEALLETPGKDRAKWLKEHADQKLGAADAKLLKESGTIDALLTALDRKIAKKITERVVPAGAIVLQPSDERRRSGSHYTPRSLTEPIVRTTLEPILNQLVGNTSPKRKRVNPTNDTAPVAPDDTDIHSLALRACIAADLPTVYEPTRDDKRRYTQGELAARIRLSEKAVEYARQAREVGTPHPSQILDLKICDPAMGSGAFLVETCRQLAEELIRAWYAHDLVPGDIPPDEDEVLYARRLIAQRCLYGVDKNDMAVDLAKLSLWLVTLAKDHPFTFLDHSLRHGDSLVGLTRRQIIGFHWEPKKQKQFGEDLIQKRLDRATEARAKILNAREDVPYRDQEQRLAVADEALNVVRMTGDACVSAFFAGSKKKEREDRCEELFASVSDWYASGHDINRRGPIAEAAASLRSGEHPIPPFHWETEYPEVFSRKNGGFDGFIGNPPFLGGARVSTTYGMAYFDFIKTQFPPAGHQCDLVGYFFRQAFEKLRKQAALGFIATNTIAQGDTREGALVPILQNHGQIYNAVKRFSWPGQAAVVASYLHIGKSLPPIKARLDGRLVRRVSAYLMAGKVDGSPQRLETPYNSKGSQIYGQGFLFDDHDSKASPLSTMRELNQEKRYAHRIFPYIGGEEVNSMPTPNPYRYAIYLSDLETEEDLKAVPALAAIVRERVKPERDKLGNNPNNTPLKKRWWAYQAHRPELYTRLKARQKVLVHAQVGPHMEFSFLPPDWIYSQQLILFDLESNGAFATLQSRVHEVWVRFLASSMKDDLRYTPSDCFATFPFPENFDDDPTLEEIGTRYIDERSTICLQSNQGLTKTYNRFHDPHEKSSEIAHLRELHEAMDRAVLEAYGWDDLAQSARCEFLLDYEEEEEDEPGAKKSKKKKPWRLRWPDDFRDEVLARLLELNEQRHQEELLAGKLAEQSTKPQRKTARRKKSGGSNSPNLPGM
jgi:hypothetical protein